MDYKAFNIDELREDIPDLHGVPDSQIRFAVGMFCNGAAAIKLLGTAGCELLTYQQLRAIQKYHSVVALRAEFYKWNALAIAMENQDLGRKANEYLESVVENTAEDTKYRVDAAKHLSDISDRASERLAKYADTEEKAELRKEINMLNRKAGLKEI